MARHSESGMAMVLVMTMLAALLAIGAIGLSLQLNSTKSAGLAKESRSALYCAESGLATARNLLVSNRSVWNVLLDGNASNDPVWYTSGGVPGITGDLDGDGVVDYRVTVRDDGDDTDLTSDSNDTVIVVSVCIKYDDAPSTVMEVISMQGRGQTYRNQSGQGPGNTGNAN